MIDKGNFQMSLSISVLVISKENSYIVAEVTVNVWTLKRQND